MPRSQKVAEAMYRTLLRIYPPQFRQRMGREIVEAFRDGCLQARVRRGQLGAFLFAMQASTELVWHGFQERRAGRAAHPRSTRRGNMFDRFGKDVRYALRNLQRTPAFTLVVLLTLGLMDVNSTTLTFSPDGQRLFSGMNDGTVLVWDIGQAYKTLGEG